MEIHNVCGIRFKRAGKKYYFDPKDLKISVHDKVVVETIRGLELGEVIEDIKQLGEDDIISTLKPVIRIATELDLENNRKNEESIPATLDKAKYYVKKSKLDMKLLGCEYTVDRSKLILYFNAEGRVDFRDLVKDLANEFRVRIELRQVGTRDGAKFLGGIGPCGLILCCNSFLGEFDTVSIKMAKNQNLSLNPANISGLCGKLLCCIKYEEDAYKELKKTMHNLGEIVKTAEGKGKIISQNLLKQTVGVKLFDADGIQHFSVDDVKVLPNKIDPVKKI